MEPVYEVQIIKTVLFSTQSTKSVQGNQWQWLSTAFWLA